MTTGYLCGMNSITAEDIASALAGLQDEICQQIAAFDGTDFYEDAWERPGGGGGRSRVIKGNVIEKGGVNFSKVYGDLDARAAKSLGIEAGPFLATGVSIVLHPKNPFCPIIHMNVRYFEDSVGQWWFGGGIDLTPHYVVEADAKIFHERLKSVCDSFNADWYAKFKPWADDYFFIRHRKETRGIGGIFYDRLGADTGMSKEQLLDFTLAVGRTFAPLYIELVKRNMNKTFTEAHVAWQRLRRGRYVEFNLIWDRGTKFGLETDGRTESILMSLPPLASWEYDHQTEPESLEAATLALLVKGIDWV
jgi:coproporphyrinogen III oxidase